MRKLTDEEREARRVQRNADVNQWRKMLKDAHICRGCGKQDAYTLGGRSYCVECAEKNAEWRRNWAREHPGRDRDNRRALVQKWKAEGRCSSCGKPMSDRRYLVCLECRLGQKRIKVEKRRKSLVNWPRGENGYCWLCNKEKAIEGKRLCQTCYDRVLIRLDKRNRDNSGHVWRAYDRSECRRRGQDRPGDRMDPQGRQQGDGPGDDEGSGHYL